MSEEIREQAAGEAVTETKADVKAAPTIAEQGAVETPKAEEKPAEQPKAEPTAWPEDWRDKLSSGDEKVKNLLGRYTDPAAMAKAFKELRAQYDARDKSKDPAPELPENPTDEQLAEWRKAKGIPLKPEDYEFEVPEGKELSDGEYDILMDFAKEMHGNNVPADMVKKISGWFLNYEDVIAQRNADRAYQARSETEEKLRAEWGADYKANVNLMANVLQEHLGSKSAEFLAQPLMDGTRIGDNEMFIRLMAEVSRKIGGSTAELYTTDVHTTGKGLEARKAELLKMSTDADPLVRKKYHTPEIQAELLRIQTALSKRAG